ncbi:MAG: VOC family protein [Gammaproteobacteria bacterium]
MDWSRLFDSDLDNIYHFAMIVPDFDRALRAVGAQLGVQAWAEPQDGMNSVRLPDGRVSTVRLRATYSRQGPPFVELIEGVADPHSVFTIAGGPRLHHVGVHVADWRAAVERMQARGMTLEGVMLRAGPDPEPMGIAFMRNAFGLRIEVVDVSRRTWLRGWLAPAPPAGP